jgi:NAD(P)H-hydrate epimerase
VLAIDVPSGIDAELGTAAGEAVQATVTVTLALPKTGLLREEARLFVGRLFLADIGIPRPLLAALNIDTDGLFEDDDIVELR